MHPLNTLIQSQRREMQRGSTRPTRTDVRTRSTRTASVRGPRTGMLRRAALALSTSLTRR